MNYQQRVVAFIDILGFKEILRDTVKSNGADDVKKIREIIVSYDVIRDLDKKSILLNTCKWWSY